MNIDVDKLTERIRQQGDRNRAEQQEKVKKLQDTLIFALDTVNKTYLEDAKSLCRIYMALKSAGLRYAGDDGRYIADGMRHKLGFLEQQDGSVCLCVKGGGFCGTNQLFFARNGNNTEAAYYEHLENSILGDAIEVVRAPEQYGIDTGWLHKFTDRVQEIVRGFEQFRDEYIAYAQQQLD